MSRLVFLLLFISLSLAERHGFPSSTLSMYKDSSGQKRSPVLIDSTQDDPLSPYSSMEEHLSALRPKRDIQPEKSPIATKVTHLKRDYP